MIAYKHSASDCQWKDSVAGLALLSEY